MKLCAHILNGKIVGVDVPVNPIIDIPFKIESEPSLGYADISSVKNWWKFGRFLNRDYLFVRSQVKNLIAQKGIDSCQATLSTPPVATVDNERYYIDPNATATDAWTGYEGYIATWDLPNNTYVLEPTEHVGYRLLDAGVLPGGELEEKLIAAKYKIGSQKDHFADFGSPAIVHYGVIYHKESQKCRAIRKLFSTVDVYNKLPQQSGQILSELISVPNIGNLLYLYEEWGIKGQLEDYNVDFNTQPAPGVADYLYARGVFDGSQQYTDMGFPVGLLAKNLTTIDNKTPQEFCDELYSILVSDGVYDAQKYLSSAS